MTDTVAATEPKANTPTNAETPPNFVADLVRDDVAAGKHKGRIVTRFPPEPNGYLHIGHAKSICLNFGIAKEMQGTCNLRFDDTNPETEDVEYVESIKNDIHWLGFDWGKNVFFASDYFEKLHAFATAMIERGVAYVDSRTLEEIRETRGDFHKEGTDSPFRTRSVAENLDLFRRMRAGEFPDGAHVLRAKGDMASKDVKMRDPVMYRIRHAKHHRTGDQWVIYPMYDWAHGQSDYIENVTHSVCSLEFVNHRPLYHWFLDQVGADKDNRPQQIEFARLNLTYTVLSKRKLQELVFNKHVDGWDDPRMPTLSGLRRRGFTPEAIRAFCERVGVSTRDSLVDVALLEHALREDLNARAPRLMGVLRPLKVTIRNIAEGENVACEAPWFPEGHDQGLYAPTAVAEGTRKMSLGRTIYIEQDDFMLDPPKKFFRLAPGQEVRLRYACILKCVDVVRDAAGHVTELIAEWDPNSKGGTPADGRKIKGTIHWVAAHEAVPCNVDLYDRLFLHENPLEDKDTWLRHVNPNAKESLTQCWLEPAATTLAPGHTVQLERLGYFTVDKELESKAKAKVAGEPLRLNRTISLKDSSAK
jgi:glutaminyl-tRNA synthetase